MNRDAGRGNQLFVTVRLEDGRQLPFSVDTGSADTIIDTSLKPGLGNPIDSVRLFNFGVESFANRYPAPKLYLGNTLLKVTGGVVIASPMRTLAGADPAHPLMGILGMSVLRNYCIQLDFASGKIHFLDGERVKQKIPGTPFPLHDLGDGCFSIADNPAGVKGSWSLIDTGCNYDGWLAAPLYSEWTNVARLPSGGEARYPAGVLAGQSFAGLFHVQRLEPAVTDDSHLQANGLGLHFLARHLVTFDFAGRTMYLKRTSDGPLPPEGVGSARKFLMKLKSQGQLPGWPREDKRETLLDPYAYPDPDTIIFSVHFEAESPVCRYTVVRNATRNQWKLQKAQRRDRTGKVLEEFPLR